MNRATVLPSSSLASHSFTRTAMLSFFAGILCTFSTFAQDSTAFNHIQSSPSIIYNPDIAKNALTISQVHKRVKLVAAANIAIYGSTMAALYSTWYKNYPQTHFHFFNDIREWQQMDKIGHAYSAYAESKVSMELWRWTGIDRKKRILLGGMSGAVYQTVIEILDGFSAQWGFSWGDFTANIVGSGMFVAQELAWNDQRIQYKFSFHRKSYSDPNLNARSDKIFGKSLPERALKDYNGQTYWLSTNIKSFFPKSRLPGWLEFSVGTGAEGMFGAFNNTGNDSSGNINFNRTDIKRYRHWYLSPDIDFSKIPTRHRGLKFALRMLNIVKFPLPTLEYSKGSFKFHAALF